MGEEVRPRHGPWAAASSMFAFSPHGTSPATFLWQEVTFNREIRLDRICNNKLHIKFKTKSSATLFYLFQGTIIYLTRINTQSYASVQRAINARQSALLCERLRETRAYLSCLLRSSRRFFNLSTQLSNGAPGGRTLENPLCL